MLVILAAAALCHLVGGLMFGPRFPPGRLSSPVANVGDPIERLSTTLRGDRTVELVDIRAFLIGVSLVGLPVVA